MIKYNQIILFILYCVSLASCSKDSVVYTKFVYELPREIPPYDAINEVDIWFSRLKHRGLTKNIPGNLIELDLAEEIITNDFIHYQIKIKPGQKFSDGSPIDGKALKLSLESVIRNYSGNLAKQIEKIDVLSKSEIIVKLKSKNEFFKHALASHIFLIHSPKDIKVVSGLYKMDTSSFYLVDETLGYPTEIIAKPVNKLSQINTKFYDTALLPPGSITIDQQGMEYQIFETWGLVLNLKGRFNRLKDRKCLDQSVNRESLIENVLNEQKAVTRMDGTFNNQKKCRNKLDFKLDIPIELGDLAPKLCIHFKKQHNISCNIIEFNHLLRKLQSDDFDASLISLTLDISYVESINEYLSKNKSFSIINLPKEVPSILKIEKGNKYISALSNYLSENSYFISLSRPTRKILGNKIESYIPSLIGPSYDYLENLKR